MARQAEMLDDLGIVQSRRKQPAAAIRLYEEALRLWRASGDQFGEALTLNRVLAGPNDEAANACLEQSLRLFRGLGDRWLEARTLFNFSQTYAFLPERADETRSYLEQALQLWRALGDELCVANALFYLAAHHAWLGDHESARDDYRQSWQLAARIGFFDKIITSHLRLGEICYQEGEYQQALDYYEQALRQSREAGSEPEAYALYNLGTVWFAFDDLEQAFDFFSRALPRWGKGLNGMAYTLDYLGRIAQVRGQPAQARDFYERALEKMQSTCDVHGETRVLNHLGVLAAEAGHWPRAFELYARALALSRRTQFPRNEAETLLNLGRAHYAAGAWPLALEHFTRAREVSSASKLPRTEAEARYEMARVELQGGELDRVRQQSAAAVELIESLQTNLTREQWRTSYLASVQKYYELYADVLMRLDAARPREGFAAAALETSEQARARGLLELLAAARVDVRRGADAGLLERERQLVWRLNARAARQTRLLGGKHDEHQAALLAAEIKELSDERQRVADRIRAASPAYAALTRPTPLKLAELQQLLDDDTLLVEYALGDERSYAWAVSRDSLQAYALPPRAEIEPLARRAYEALTARNQRPPRQALMRRADAEWQTISTQLSRILLEPVTSLRDHPRLLIVSEGALQYVPFAALPDPKPSATALVAASPLFQPTTPPTAVVPAIVTLRLSPNLVRDSAPPSQLRLSPEVTSVRLQLEIEDDRYSTYRVHIRTAEGQSVLTRNGLRAPRGGMLMFTFPASLLARADYVVELSGVDADGRAANLHRYSFRAEKK